VLLNNALLSVIIHLSLIMSIKYKFHDSTAIYFVSFAVMGWIDVFTRTVNRDLLLESLAYCRKENTSDHLYSSAIDYEGEKGLIGIYWFNVGDNS
jgi:hypothetical protein